MDSVDILLDVSSGEFEDMVVVGLYQAFGHQAKRTGKSGDHGVDVVVKAKNEEQWVTLLQKPSFSEKQMKNLPLCHHSATI